MATHSSILARESPWREESAGLPSMESHGHNLETITTTRSVINPSLRKEVLFKEKQTKMKEKQI